MAHLTDILGNAALAEFVCSAVLALWQWRRYRLRGTGWAALSFLLLAGIGLTGRGVQLGPIAPDQALLKLLVGVLLLVPFGLYRFAAEFDRPRRLIRSAAGA